MGQLITFEDWMANYAPNAYRESAIKQYIRFLNKAPEILDVNLKLSVLECRNSGGQKAERKRR